LNDNELRGLLDQYLDPPQEFNRRMCGVEVIWERVNAQFGSRHIWEEHGVTEEEVEQVLMEVPPEVEARRHPEHPNRTVFWGATRYDRWIIVVCEDWMREDVRYLRPITAFEPTEGASYWERLT
jgi:uncharacterized DUF497 family protein